MVKKTGRPLQLTPEIVSKLEAAFHNDYTITEACAYSGVGRATYYRWIEDYAWFRDKMTRSQMQLNMKARSLVAESIRDGDVATARWWLKHRHSDEFNTRAISSSQSQYLPRTWCELLDAATKTLAKD